MQWLKFASESRRFGLRIQPRPLRCLCPQNLEYHNAKEGGRLPPAHVTYQQEDNQRHCVVFGIFHGWSWKESFLRSGW